MISVCSRRLQQRGIFLSKDWENSWRQCPPNGRETKGGRGSTTGGGGNEARCKLETLNYLDPCLLDHHRECVSRSKASTQYRYQSCEWWDAPRSGVGSHPGALAGPLHSVPAGPLMSSAVLSYAVGGEVGVGVYGGNRSVFRNVNEISLYLVFLFFLPLTLSSTLLTKRQSFLGCKTVVGKAWLDTLILLSFGWAWKKTPPKKKNEWTSWKEMYFPIIEAALPKVLYCRPPIALPTTWGRKLAGVCGHRNRQISQWPMHRSATEGDLPQMFNYVRCSESTFYVYTHREFKHGMLNDVNNYFG